MSVVPELLAPAGSSQAHRAAIIAGDDAVYLGGKAFGTRKYAENFDRTELSQAILYAHKNSVTVYVTVNTLTTDDELPYIADYLTFLSDIDVDAVLVLDLGVLSRSRDIVLDLSIHASTYMTIHNTSDILFASKHGISRVVLARELSLEDVLIIGDIAKKYSIELEVFCPGSICYAYSGQCLLSSVIDERSGNRGMCSQPCRKPYTILSDDVPLLTRGNCPLSPRELCLYPYLKETC
ncbi:MAG TPA: U32 family peptidase, partial [Methanocorpusculum sp.]|nr:U32 family peptidase [Methanocorpusculum sp.]